MERTLTLEVPENVYNLLRKSAEHMGQIPEVLAAQLLAEAAERLEHDPLEELVGAFHSAIADWSDQHDQYLGQSITDSLHHTGGVPSPDV